MAKYRTTAVAGLARQMAFTPAEARAHQVAAAERLLHDLDPAKAYPIDFVVYRVTDYQPNRNADPANAAAFEGGNADLLTGIALQHDLGLLIEQVSDGLDLRAADLAEPVLTIDDVTARFDVTSKTIQRWRRRGLPARRFAFPDGKRRVGFLLSSVERFVHPAGGAPAGQGLVAADTVADVVRHARRLGACGCDVDEVTRRVGRRTGRSPLAVLHTLRKHDAEHPAVAVLPQLPPPADEVARARVLRKLRRGVRLAVVARKVRRTRSSVLSILLRDRADRLARRKVRFVDDPLYHGPDADRAVAAVLAQQPIGVDPAPGELRVPRDLPAYFRELYRVPLLSPPRERALFLAFNYHKARFAAARRRLDPELAGRRDLDHLDACLSAATAVKNDILRANLRLVVAVARRHVRPGVTLMELVSEGNLTLMRAVDGFDVHKGNRFSTYATLALMKGFAQTVPLMQQAARRAGDASAELSTVADARGADAADRHAHRDQISHLLSRLDDRERTILQARFGLCAEPDTDDQLARRLGLTPRRVRHIERAALAKLRDVACSG